MKTVQIDCILEFSFEGELTRDELIAKATEALESTSYKEMGEMLQVEKDTNEWHCFDDDDDEEMED